MTNYKFWNLLLKLSKKDSKIVYKYRDWNIEEHKDILIKNQLYLSSPKDFNDPFDCRIPTNFYLLNTKEKKKKYVDQVVIRNFEILEKEGKNIKFLLNDYTRRLKENIDEEQRNNEKITFESQDKHYGVLSLSAIWDSLLMWSHYGSKHTGFCVGFFEDKLRNPNLFGKGGMVNYLNNFPKINPLDEKIEPSDEDIMKKAFLVIHSKAKEWKYEKEYRLTKTYPKSATIEERKVKIEDSFFAEIILGLNITKENKEQIIKIANQKNIPVYQAKKVPFKFKLTREKIN